MGMASFRPSLLMANRLRAMGVLEFRDLQMTPALKSRLQYKGTMNPQPS